MKRTVFHTVRSDKDKDAILKNAPFFCKDDPNQLKEWLGSGYYFWETFEKLGKWWGIVHYIRAGKHFIICKTVFECPEEEMLDLVSNTEQLQDIQEIVDVLKARPEFKTQKFTAQFIIKLICEKAGVPFKAVRAYGQESSSSDDITKYKFFFNRRSFFNGCPEIQICVKDLSVIKRPMTIVYCSEDDTGDAWTI